MSAELDAKRIEERLADLRGACPCGDPACRGPLTDAAIATVIAEEAEPVSRQPDDEAS